MRKSGFGLQSIDAKISHLLKPIFNGNKKELVLISNLTKNWEEIIGKKYSKSCYAKSVSFGKSKEEKGKLTIAVHNSAAGYFLQNNSELVIERIATFYGFKSIAKIIIKQEPKEIENQKKEIAKLPENEEKILQNATSSIKDEELAKTLQNLRRLIYHKSDK